MSEKDFGSRIRKGRLSQNLSQTDLAKKAGISRTYLSQIERGESANLSWQVRKSLSEVLGIPIEADPAVSERLEDLPPGLSQFAQDRNLPEADIQMLARLEYRGKKPNTPEQWRLLYGLIKSVIGGE